MKAAQHRWAMGRSSCRTRSASLCRFEVGHGGLFLSTAIINLKHAEIAEKKRGRLHWSRPGNAIRLPEDLRVRVEAWLPSSVMRLSFRGDPPAGRDWSRGRGRCQASNKKSAAKAAGLAGAMVDYLSDQSARPMSARNASAAAKRPSEFREMRTIYRSEGEGAIAYSVRKSPT